MTWESCGRGVVAVDLWSLIDNSCGSLVVYLAHKSTVRHKNATAATAAVVRGVFTNKQSKR